MYSISLPDTATAADLAAAARFFTDLADRQAQGDHVISLAFKPLRAAAEVTPPAPVHPSGMTPAELAGDPPTPPLPADAPEIDPPFDAVAAFGGGAAAQVPPPLPPIAPSTAGAGQSSTAPVAPTGTFPVPPVPQAPAPLLDFAALVPPGDATPEVPAPAVEVDKRGLPWDARIHASTKTQTQKGQWTARRGVDEATVAAVEAELRAAMGAPAAPPAPAAPAAPPVVAGTPVMPPAPAAPVPPAPVSTFPQFIAAINPHVAAGRLTHAAINGALADVGLPPGLGSIAVRADLIPAVWAKLQQIAGVATP